MCFYASWQNFANMRSPAKMTTTARTASKLCASSQSKCPEMFFLDLISCGISESIEPWPECQPNWRSRKGIQRPPDGLHTCRPPPYVARPPSPIRGWSRSLRREPWLFKAQGEDNRRGQKQQNDYHTPADPEGSADTDGVRGVGA